ncbi:hypothetical protein TNCT_688641 [Trichonephila clavata]|uniref:Uncharacterized protein n=1 Tax=Trichonephila clavata TaxID=2740835 RepID=A0A8X6FTB1_TRICU|nr:hypothetical protein TNCT_688641 [Trichonephila clavata]
MVLVGMGETIDSDLRIPELKQKLLSKAYLEYEELIRDDLATTIEDRMEKEKDRKEEEYKDECIREKEEDRKKEEYKDECRRGGRV